MTLPSEVYPEIEISSDKKICKCATCEHRGIAQLLSNFSKDKKHPDGFNIRCKDCTRISHLKSRQAASEPPPEEENREDSATLKVCTKCKMPKPISAFHKSKKTKDGRKEACKQCRSTRKPKVPKEPTPIPEFKVCSKSTCHLAGILQPIGNFYRMPTQPYRSGIDS